MGIYELTELDSSVRSNVIGGFWLKHCPESSESPETSTERPRSKLPAQQALVRLA